MKYLCWPYDGVLTAHRSELIQPSLFGVEDGGLGLKLALCIFPKMHALQPL